jgi:hypothetical protein
MSASAFGVGRLAIWEELAVILGASGSPGLGRWDEYRAWVANADGYSETEWRANLAAIVAVHPRVQLWGRLPLVATSKEAFGTREAGGGPGDGQAGARFEALSIGEFSQLPALAFNLGVTAPTGRAVNAAKKPLASDVTGRGSWILSAGVSLERAELPWYVQLNAGVFVPLASRREDMGADQRYGTGVEVALAGGVELREGLVLSLVLRASRDGEITLGEAPVANSGGFDLGGGPTLSLKLSPHWTVQAGLDTGMFRTGFGDNRPGRVTANAGLRYGHF